MAEIRLEGLNEIKARLAFMQDQQGVQAGLKAAAQQVRGVAQVYPPRPAHSTYNRTNRLRDGWRVRVNKRSATVRNKVKYGPYVQGDKQTGFHAITGWKTVDTIAEEQTDDIVKALMESINRILSGG